VELRFKVWLTQTKRTVFHANAAKSPKANGTGYGPLATKYTATTDALTSNFAAVAPFTAATKRMGEPFAARLIQPINVPVSRA